MNNIRKAYPGCFFLGLGDDFFTAGVKVYNSIKFHPDIFFFKVDEKTLIYSPCINKSKLNEILNLGISLIKGQREQRGKYPLTCGYNALKVGKYMFHALKYTDPVILAEMSRRGYEAVNVNQGYAGCSSVVIGENAAITADPGMKKALEDKNIEVLFISTGGITLPGEKYGFIGGASGNLPCGKIMFFGDLAEHKDGSRIRNFIIEHNSCTLESPGCSLYDPGSFLMF